MIILSDIHANLTALKAVIKDFESKYNPDKIMILGDVIDYGMRPNECVKELQKLEEKYAVDFIWGNHEYEILTGRYSGFSSERGVASAKATAKMLNEDSRNWFDKFSMADYLFARFVNQDIMFIHGSIEKPLWGTIDDRVDADDYQTLSYVISGHSHIPHFFKKFYEIDNKKLRNKKYVAFINPGSVGQPRNQNVNAQYVFADFETESFHFNSVPYDIDAEAKLYDGTLDNFYKERLYLGI